MTLLLEQSHSVGTLTLSTGQTGELIPAFNNALLTCLYQLKVSKGAMIRNRYNQVPYLTQVTNGKETNSQ